MAKTARSKAKKRAVPRGAKGPRRPVAAKKPAPKKPAAPRRRVVAPRVPAPRGEAPRITAPRITAPRIAVAPQRPRPAPPTFGNQTLSLPPGLAGEVRGTLAEWAAGERTARLWRGDAAL